MTKPTLLPLIALVLACTWREARPARESPAATSRSSSPASQRGVRHIFPAKAPEVRELLEAWHRRFHRFWGFGFLEDLNEKADAGASPWQDPSLVVELEIVVNSVGVVERVSIVMPSSYLPFDAAALDVVYWSGPYPAPPKALQSTDGRTRVSWLFHRDERACTPKGAMVYTVSDPSRWDAWAVKNDPFGPMIVKKGEEWRRRRAAARADGGARGPVDAGVTDG